MARYCLLTAAAGYVGSYSALNSGRKTAAEAEADAFVDGFLDGFDTDLWTPTTTPTEIRQAADKYAAARYVRLELAALQSTRSADAVEGSAPAKLEAEAHNILAGIASRGWYRSDDGARVPRREPDRSPRFGTLV